MRAPKALPRLPGWPVKGGRAEWLVGETFEAPGLCGLERLAEGRGGEARTEQLFRSQVVFIDPTVFSLQGEGELTEEEVWQPHN